MSVPQTDLPTTAVFDVEKFNAALIRRGLTAKTFATLIGTTSVHISMWRSGAKTPGPEMLVRIATRLAQVRPIVGVDEVLT